MNWLQLLCPAQQVPSLLDVNADALKQMGIRALLLDLDNTIVEYQSPVIRPEIYDYLMAGLQRDIKLCLLSNNYMQRVCAIADTLGIPFVPRAAKPWNYGFRSACRLLETEPEHTAIVGDQLFTDVLGGNRMGLYTIWVTPLSSREFVGTKFSRMLEKIAVFLLKRQGISSDRRREWNE